MRKRERAAESRLHRKCGRTAQLGVREEIAVHTEWAALLDSTPVTRTAAQIDGHDVWLVESLFSAEECERLISAAEAKGFGFTDYDPAYRGNLRLTATDTALAERVLVCCTRQHVLPTNPNGSVLARCAAVWRRLEPLVPSELRLREPEDKSAHWWGHYPGVYVLLMRTHVCV